MTNRELAVGLEINYKDREQKILYLIHFPRPVSLLKNYKILLTYLYVGSHTMWTTGHKNRMAYTAITN
jgi:hypothetical protein